MRETPKLVPELYCRNLDTSLAFYTLIGFTVLYDRPEDRFAYLRMGSVDLMIEEPGDTDRTWWTAPAEPPFGRGVNFQIEVDDVDAIHARLLGANHPLFRPIEEKWYRKADHEVGNRQFVVQDPDGYLLRFFTDLGQR